MNEDEYERMFAVEDAHWWYVALHSLVLDTVTAEHDRKGAMLSIFDAGCGTGRLCRLMSGFGDVSGCDISPAAVGFCHERGIRSAFRADLNGEDLGRQRYDVITSIDVLYHRLIPDDMSIIAKFFAALRPGGVLILHLPAFNAIKSRHDIAVHTKRRYTKTGIARMLRKAGFVIEKMTYRLFFLFPFIACYRLALKPFQRSGDENMIASDVWLPPPFINRNLLALHMIENRLIGKLAFPFGTSVFAVARKPDNAPDNASNNAGRV